MDDIGERKAEVVRMGKMNDEYLESGGKEAALPRYREIMKVVQLVWGLKVTTGI